MLYQRTERGEQAVKKIIDMGFILLLTLLVSCIFSPKEGKKTPTPVGKWQEPDSPGIVIENLIVSFNNLDVDFYERCLHEDYFYESLSEIDSLNVESWSRSTDVRVMEKLFDDCTSFIFTPSYVSLEREYGSNIADIPDGARVSDEHPDQIWYRYNYDISMDVFLKTFGDYKVQQFMQFIMVEEPEGHWSIIRWLDETNISQ